MNHKYEILKVVRQRIQQGWVRGHFATKIDTDVNDTKVLVQCGPADPDACAWCLHGAIKNAAFTNAVNGPEFFDEGVEVWHKAQFEVEKLLSDLITDTEAPLWDAPANRIHNYNDRFYRSQEEVLALIDKAIEEAK